MTTAGGSPPHIGTLAERSLHAAIKEWLAQPGDALEQRVDNFVIDLVRGDELHEVQTGSYGSIKRKLKALLPRYQIHLYYPLPAEKWIVRQQADGSPVGRRKSPKRGRPIDVFRELVRIPHLLGEPNLFLHIVLTREEEVLRNDGQGSWRRKRWSRHDRRLLQVVDEVTLTTPSDYLNLIPPAVTPPFTNKMLATALRCRPALAQKITYTLRRAGFLAVAGKEGRANLYTPVSGLANQGPGTATGARSRS